MRKPLLNFSILSPANFKRWQILVPELPFEDGVAG